MDTCAVTTSAPRKRRSYAAAGSSAITEKPAITAAAGPSAFWPQRCFGPSRSRQRACGVFCGVLAIRETGCRHSGSRACHSTLPRPTGSGSGLSWPRPGYGPFSRGTVRGRSFRSPPARRPRPSPICGPHSKERPARSPPSSIASRLLFCKGAHRTAGRGAPTANRAHFSALCAPVSPPHARTVLPDSSRTPAGASGRKTSATPDTD